MYSLLETFFVLFLVLHETLSLSYPTSRTNGMVGYAKAGGVTGGWSGNVVEINSLNELIKNVGDNIARVLVINSDIRQSTLTKVRMGSNKCIIGSYKKITLYNIHLRATPSSQNIIFQNLIFQHSSNIKANDDIQLYLNYGNKYWIDHCSFVGHGWSVKDGSRDKLLYIGDNGDYVTISNCYFGNHKFGLILGHTEDDNAAYNTRLTICNNHFENFDVRGPGLMRHGHYHVYNNYIYNFHLGFSLATNAKIISENNYFEPNNNNYKILDDKGTGQFTDTGSVPSITGQISPKCDWTAKFQYNYDRITASEAKNFVTAYAGVQSSTLVFSS